MADVVEVQVPDVAVTVADTTATIEVGTLTAAVEVSNERGPQGPPGEVEDVQRPAGEAVGGHRVVWSNNGSVYYVDQTQVAQVTAALGVTTGAAAQGEMAYIRVFGSLTHTGWAWTPGLPIYVVGSGQLSQTPPATGAVRQIAVAETATRIFICPQLEIRR